MCQYHGFITYHFHQKISVLPRFFAGDKKYHIKDFILENAEMKKAKLGVVCGVPAIVIGARNNSDVSVSFFKNNTETFYLFLQQSRQLPMVLIVCTQLMDLTSLQSQGLKC